MPGFYVHLCVGKAPDGQEGIIILESTPSHVLCDYTVWHTYEHYAMVRYGAQNKEKLCALWQYPPFRKKVAMVLGIPESELGRDRNTCVAAMRLLNRYQLRHALFEGLYIDVYVMASYQGGCDLYLRGPGDRFTWWHYAARGMHGGPTLWWSMPLEDPQFVAMEVRPQWTVELLSRLINTLIIIIIIVVVRLE